MQVKLLCFGISKDILGSSQVHIEVEGTTLQNLRKQLCKQYPEFDRLASLRFAVDETYRDDGYAIQEGAVVAIIPPVSGG